MTKTPTIILIAHGSRDRQATKEFGRLLAKIQQYFPGQMVKGGFLKFNNPAFSDLLEDLYDQGVRDYIIQPLTLYNANHTKEDIPDILARFKGHHPEVALVCGSALDHTDRKVVKAVIEAVRAVQPGGDIQDCKLLIVGRGSQAREVSDQTINLCRKLHEYFEFGETKYCYSFGNAPSLDSALKQAGGSHYNQIIILPYLLFSGRLLTEISREVEAARENFFTFNFHLAPPLGLQDSMITAIVEAVSTLQSSFKFR